MSECLVAESLVSSCKRFCILLKVIVFFFKQKTAYEMRISDWSSDVCSSDLGTAYTVRCRCRYVVSGPATTTAAANWFIPGMRSEERRVGKELSVRVDLGGRRIIKKKTYHITHRTTQDTKTNTLIMNHTSCSEST